MQSFVPQKIFVEAGVADLPMTKRILQKFSHVPQETLSDHRVYKEPAPISPAKRNLVLAQARGEVLKPFPKIKHAINLGDYVFNPVSNCHLECTYCILQSYLKNNPALTVFTNLDYFLQSIAAAVESQPNKTFRLGTGELSDSLALDPWTQFSHEWIPFFQKLPNAFLELKTKSDCIQGLLDLPHDGKTVLSWSLSPETIIQKEELKCATLDERLNAAAKAQQAGYPVGLHLDPLIYFTDWEQAYEDLIARMARHLDPKRLAWVSVGSLRFDKPLKEIATERFPHTKIFAEDFITSPDGKLRYFKTIRLNLYAWVWKKLRDWSEDFPRYLCMEPPWVWEQVTGGDAPQAQAMETELVQRLHFLQKQ